MNETRLCVLSRCLSQVAQSGFSVCTLYISICDSYYLKFTIFLFHVGVCFKTCFLWIQGNKQELFFFLLFQMSVLFFVCCGHSFNDLFFLSKCLCSYIYIPYSISKLYIAQYIVFCEVRLIGLGKLEVIITTLQVSTECFGYNRKVTKPNLNISLAGSRHIYEIPGQN